MSGPLPRDATAVGTSGRGMRGSIASLLVAAAALVAGCARPASVVPAPSSSTSASASSPAATPGVSDPNVSEVNPAGDIPDNQVFVPYREPGGGFSVSVPQGWARSSGTETAFTDKFNSVRLSSRPLPAAPDVASVSRDEVSALRGSTPGFALGTVSSVSRPGGSAVLVTYQADSAPDAVTGKSVVESVERYEFWRAGRAAVVTLSGPKGADNVDPWRTITDSFRWT